MNAIIILPVLKIAAQSINWLQLAQHRFFCSFHPYTQTMIKCLLSYQLLTFVFQLPPFPPPVAVFYLLTPQLAPQDDEYDLPALHSFNS